jgi:hypothetical protein
VTKKNVVAASVSSIEAFPTVGLALQVEVPTTMASIPSLKVGGVLELWLGCPVGGDSGQYPPRGDDSQYPPRGDGSQYPAGGSGVIHVEVCLATEDPPHGITGVGPV